MDGTVYLMYHELELPARKLCDGFIGHQRYAVAQSEFRRQILHLKGHDWRGMTVSEALAEPKSAVPGVAITFDDGSETDLIGAAPLLKELGFGATFYVVAGWLERPGHLSVHQLRELADLGFEIGCHSMTHASFSELNATQLHVEIADAKQKLEDILGKPVEHFSAPGGFWSRKFAQMTMDAGYRSAATSRPGVNSKSADRFNLARVVVKRKTSLHNLERLCSGNQIFAQRMREAALQVPKSLLGYSKYVKLHSLLSTNVENVLRVSRAATNSGRMSEWSKPRTPVPRALMIDYDVGAGGSAYEGMVAESLAGAFDLSRITLNFKKWGSWKYVAAPLEFVGIHRFLTACPDAVAVKTFSAALLNPKRQPPSIVILHHVGASNNPLYSVLEKYILDEIPKANAVVVVSEYWRRYLLRRGLTSVYKIHNSFKMEEFDLTTQEVESFKGRYDLLGKPIIYLGNYGRYKGVSEAFDALKDLDVHLVASGRATRGPKQMKCFFLTRRDYLCLLAASKLAIAMSQFAEGWCRSAHEAMLCRTPVVGSGQGGMGELLELGEQTICHDFRSLRGIVEGLLANEGKRADLGCKGLKFARQFTWERFQAQWIDLVSKVCAASPGGFRFESDA
jgi:peptidoglycan/xylan/chitin deacetylase (PgdA/CDA1 family)